MSSPSEAQGELLGTLAPDDRPLRGARAVAAVALQVIADLRERVKLGPFTYRPPCSLVRDERGRPMRDKSGAHIDPHDWQPSARAGWLVCTRCGLWMETEEPNRAAARRAALLLASGAIRKAP